jgi:hypothetical protein
VVQAAVLLAASFKYAQAALLIFVVATAEGATLQ